MIGAFNNHFKQICINLNPITKVFVLGLSGGMDSMALLYLLKNFSDNNKSFDTDNAYDTSTYKFTVPSGKAGKYFFVSTVAMNAAFAYVQLNIYKNGAAVKRGTAIRNDASSVTVAGALDLAVGDYIQIYCRQDATNNTESSPIYSYFDGYKLIGA